MVHAHIGLSREALDTVQRLRSLGYAVTVMSESEYRQRVGTGTISAVTLSRDDTATADVNPEAGIPIIVVDERRHTMPSLTAYSDMVLSNCITNNFDYDLLKMEDDSELRERWLSWLDQFRKPLRWRWAPERARWRPTHHLTHVRRLNGQRCHRKAPMSPQMRQVRTAIKRLKSSRLPRHNRAL